MSHAHRRQTVGVCDSIFFDLPPGRPIALRDPYTCSSLSRTDNSSAHFVAHRLYLRTASASRCSGCGAPTSIPELWKALNALSYVRPLGNPGNPSKPGMYLSRVRTSTLVPIAVCFTVVDESGNLSRIGDGSEVFAPDDALWDHLMMVVSADPSANANGNDDGVPVTAVEATTVGPKPKTPTA